MFYLADSIFDDPLNIVLIVVVLAVFVVFMFVMPMFNRRKADSQYKVMLDNVKTGYKIKTIGGIIGTVVDVDNTNPAQKLVTIETGMGNNKATMQIDINAVYQVLDPVLDLQALAKAAADEKAAAERAAAERAAKADAGIEVAETRHEKPEIKIEKSEPEFVPAKAAVEDEATPVQAEQAAEPVSKPEDAATGTKRKYNKNVK